MAALEASAPVVAILSTLIEESAGLHYGSGDHELLVDKVSDRAVEAGFESLLDYYYFLRYDPAGPTELQKLIEALVVGETYLFRELTALKVAVNRFVKPVAEQGQRPRVWCGACATGEEPFTFAMLLGEQGLLGKTELIASDISHKSLERARSGQLGRRSVRDVPSRALVDRWVRETPARGTHVAKELVDAIDFRRINLTVPPEVASVGPCDLILCRNVLIYFKDETAAQVVNALASALRPGGVLLVGVSESLLRLGTALSCEEHDGAFFYRKTA